MAPAADGEELIVRVAPTYNGQLRPVLASMQEPVYFTSLFMSCAGLVVKLLRVIVPPPALVNGTGLDGRVTV